MNKEPDNRLVEWTINKAMTQYKDDVCLMLEHNTYTLPEDLNVRYMNRFVSNSDKLIGLARTFIINGIGYDYWQNKWEDLERIADAKDYYITSLLDSKIIYYNNEEDKQRFLYLQAKLRANLANPKYMYERGLEWLNKAMDIYKTLMFEDSLCNVRKGAGFIADHLSVAVACANQQYFKRGIVSQIELLSEMKHIPRNFVELYQKIVRIKSVDELKVLSHDMIAVTRDFFKAQNKWSKAETSVPDYTYLASWYQECSYYFRRLYYYCSNNMPEIAFHQSIGLQADLDYLSVDFHISDLDLLSSFDASDLADYAAHAKMIEQKIITAIEENGITIESYPTVDDFLQKNS